MKKYSISYAYAGNVSRLEVDSDFYEFNCYLVILRIKYKYFGRYWPIIEMVNE